MFGKVTHGLGDDPSIVNATPASIEAALRRVVRPGSESVLVLRPGARGGYPAVLTDSSGVPDAFPPIRRKVVEIPKLPAREATPAKLPAMETATLSNGIRLVHYTMPAAPLAYIAAAARGGWSNMPEGKEGLLAFAANVARRGAGDRPYDAFLKVAKDIGATIDNRDEAQGTFLTLSVPVDRLDAGVSLLADVVQRPRFDAQEWKIAQGEMLDWLARREADLPGVASRAADAVLFAPPAGKARPDWSIAALRTFTRDETEAVFRKAFKPAATTFYSVGPAPIAVVAASLEKAFGGWRGEGDFYVAEEAPPARFPAGRTVLLVADPGASQAALWVARPAPGVEEPMRHETVAVAGLLGGSFTSRLNTVIREQRGYSYGVGIALFDRMRTGSALVVQTTVQRDKTGPALQEVFEGFAGLATVPVTAEEVNRTITSYRQALAGEAETGRGLMRDLLSAIGVGSTLEASHDSRVARTLLEVQAVAGQAYALSGLDPSLVVVAGDPEIVLPQLKQIGLTDVRLVARESDALETDRSGIRADQPAAPGGNTIGLDAEQVPATTRPIHACGDGSDTPPSCTKAAK
jgi:predicted Zn-dependent peptidase